MRISLLDPGLLSTHGHHLDLDLRIARAFSQLGHSVEILAHQDISADAVARVSDSGIAIHRTFQVYAYAGAPETADVRTLQSVIEAARRTAADLARVQTGDISFWPTFTPVQFLACARRGDSGRAVGGVWYDADFLFAFGGEAWAQAARMVAGKPGTIVVGAYDDIVRQNYATLSGGLAIGRLPVPHDGALPARRSGAIETVGFFGHQRAARGSSFLRELVQHLTAKGLRVMVQDSGRNVFGDGRDRRVTVLGHVENFAATLAQCDLVVWPSDAKSYRGNVSGIVSEAIASGIPLVLPSNCIPAYRVAEIGSGAFFHHFSASPILRAIDEAIARYPQLSAAAQRGAEVWRAREGTLRLAQTILQLV